MGFLDKLLGRRKSEAGEDMKTAPPLASMPAEDTHEHSSGEDEHAQEHDEDSGLDERRRLLALPERACGPVACVTSVEGARTLGVSRLCARSLTDSAQCASPRPRVALW